MLTRDVLYTSHRPSAPALHGLFVMAEVEPPEGPHHALLAPRAWLPVTPLPVAETADAPLICALFLEHAPPQPESASLQVFTVPRAEGALLDDALARLVAHEGLAVTSTEPVPADGGLRAWARNDGFVLYVRIVPIEARWLVVAGRCPVDRLPDVGAALDYGVRSLVLGPAEAPPWSLDSDDPA
jgi:hypothetical protein